MGLLPHRGNFAARHFCHLDFPRNPFSTAVGCLNTPIRCPINRVRYRFCAENGAERHRLRPLGKLRAVSLSKRQAARRVAVATASNLSFVVRGGEAGGGVFHPPAQKCALGLRGVDEDVRVEEHRRGGGSPAGSLPARQGTVFALLALPCGGIGDHVLQPAQRPQRGEGFPALAEHLRGCQPRGGFRFIRRLQRRLDAHPAVPQFCRQRQMQAAIGMRFENGGDGAHGREASGLRARCQGEDLVRFGKSRQRGFVRGTVRSDIACRPSASSGP